MKTPARSLSFLAALACGFSTAPAADELDQISSGKVTSVSEDKSMLTITSAQTKKPIIYYGLADAQITAANGDPVGLDAVSIGTNVTVHYLMKDKRVHVSRIVLPAETAEAAKAIPATRLPGSVLLPGAERRALKGDALRDGDITTNPGSKALIDGDRTTQPGSKAKIDGDITTQPGSKARTDRDRTTQPGSKAKIDGDITTKDANIRPNDGDRTTKAENQADKDGDITTKKGN